MKSFKTNRTFKTGMVGLAAAGFMAASLFGAAAPAYAIDLGEGVHAPELTKTLNFESGTYVPNATFTFKIEPGTAVDASNGNPAIYAGEGSPTIDNAVFAPGETADSDGTESKTVTVDFSNVTFSKPGIFRYIISENASNVDGVTDDTSTKTLDVYVTYEDGELKISSFALYKGTITGNTNLDDEGGFKDHDGVFANTYTTYDLKVTKTVTGNQGDRNKDFNFGFTISGLTPGNKYVVEDADGKTQTFTADDNGFSSTLQLKSGESFTIYGLTANDQYAITEDDYSSDGYTTAYQINTGEATSGREITATNMGNDDVTVTFTNYKNTGSPVPTGILLQTAPYIGVAAVVVAGGVALTVTKRKQN